MVRSFRSGALAAVLVLSLAPLAACAAGNSSQTSNVHPDSASASKGPIQVQNAYVLTQTSGPATVSARVFNNGSSDQTLQSVQLAGALNATLSGAGGGTVTVPAHGSVLLGGKGNPSAVIDTGSESLQNGNVQQAVFDFSSTGPVSVLLNVTPASGFFEPYGPSSIATTQAPSPAGPGQSPSPVTGQGSKPGKPAKNGQGTATPTGTTTPGSTTVTVQ